MRGRPFPLSPVVTALAVLVLSGCGSSPGGPDSGRDGAGAGPATESPGALRDDGAPGDRAAAREGGASGERAAEALPTALPGLGPKTLADVPEKARQALVVTGESRDSSRSRAVLYERSGAGWRAGTAWPAHNALRGWTDDHHAGDLRSPIGVFGLTDAGGRLPDPGSGLPYDQSGAFTVDGTGFEGEPLAGSFDYVVAINYNRRPGTTPLDWTRPLGAGKGGGIWLHVDHDGPTQGCVSLRKEHMRELLRALDPEAHPVVVMGDAASLGR